MSVLSRATPDASAALTVETRRRPPIAPLVFTGIGIARAISLRSGTKGN
jgi:hypothetical protein